MTEDRLHVTRSHPQVRGCEGARESSDLEYSLRCLRDLESRVQVKFEDLHKRITELCEQHEERYDNLNAEFDRCVQALEDLRTSVADLSSSIIRHLEGDADSTRKQKAIDLETARDIGRINSELAALATQSGGAAGTTSGAVAGRAAAKRWGAIWTAIGVSLSMIASAAFQHCASSFSPAQEQQPTKAE